VKLLYAPQSPFARKVRAVMIELGLEGRLELEYAEVRPGKRNAAYAQTVNPLRKIPALLDDDGGTVIVDSTVICEYLDALAGGGRVFPLPGPDRWRVLTQHAVAHGMCEAVILIRYETWLRPLPLRWSDWVDDQWDKVWTGATWFEDRAATALALPEGPLDISHVALACCLGYVDFRYPETGWRSRFPRLADWYQSIASRPSLRDTQPRDPPNS
jgi:glutathione S-transferase